MIYDPDTLATINEIEGYDPEFIPHYYNHWSTYEESGWVLICEKDSEFYIAEGGYSVMCSDNTDHFYPQKITEQTAIETMEEWENNYED